MAPVIAGVIVGGYGITRVQAETPRSDTPSAVATAKSVTPNR